MFSDMAGYTSLMGKDESKAISLVKIAREFQEASINKFSGRLVDEAGDAVLACFKSASDAVYCALDILKSSRNYPGIHLHLGIHIGEVIFSDDKVYGDGVNIAARIDTAARAGEICVSEDVWKNIRNKEDLKAELIGKRYFKNVSEPICLYRIITGSESSKQTGLRFRNLIESINLSHIGKRGYMFLLTILVFAAILIILFHGNFLSSRESPEKTVAVLPFKNDSPEKANEYFCNGVMEQIILHLQKIEGFRVPSRTSIEPFRDSRESPKKIAAALGVVYLLEGSVQRSGEQVKIMVRLVNAGNGMSVWEDSFDRNITDIFEVQRDIAVQVAYALNATFTPEEKNRIYRKSSRSVSAYDYYLQARDYHVNYSKNLGKDFLEKAIGMYRQAIAMDTNYAEAYTGLALAYWDKYYYSTYLSENFLDSANKLVDRSLKINDDLEEAYWLRSQYEYEKGNFNLAVRDVDHALRINPNYTSALWFKGILTIWYAKDFAGGLKILMNVIRYEHGSDLPSYLRNLGYIYFQLGMYDLSEQYNLAYAKLSGDSSRYYYYLTEEYRFRRDYPKARIFLMKLAQNDTLKLDYLYESGWISMQENDFKKALNSFLAYDSLTAFRQNHMLRIGYLYWMAGNRIKAGDYFNEQIMICSESIRMNRWYATLFREAYYDLSGIYFFTGDYSLGIKYFNEFGNQDIVPCWMIELVKLDPLLKSMRSSPDYQSVLSRLSGNLEAERKKVVKMLEEEGNPVVPEVLEFIR